MPKKALTLIEILISMLILSLVAGGFASLYVSTKQQTLHVHSRMAAAELGRYFLDRLQMDVREDTWNTTPVGNPPPTGNLLSPVNDPNSNYISSNLPAADFPSYSGYTLLSWLEEPNLNNIDYYPVFEVSDQGGVRRVVLHICWIEPAP